MIAINIGAGGVKVGDRRLTRKEAIEALDYWEELLVAMRRPYTATFDQFLYSDNDPVVERARRQLEAKQEEKRKHEVDWTKSLMRNNKAREEGSLGDQKPLTHWDNQDNFHPSDSSDWRWWTTTQPREGCRRRVILTLCSSRPGREI